MVGTAGTALITRSPFSGASIECTTRTRRWTERARFGSTRLEVLISTALNCVLMVALGMSLEVFALYKPVMVVVILFHHSNLRIPPHLDSWLRWVIVPPSLHRVHHSNLRWETDSDYGTIFRSGTDCSDPTVPAVPTTTSGSASAGTIAPTGSGPRVYSCCRCDLWLQGMK